MTISGISCLLDVCLTAAAGKIAHEIVMLPSFPATAVEEPFDSSRETERSILGANDAVKRKHEGTPHAELIELRLHRRNGSRPSGAPRYSSRNGRTVLCGFGV